MADITEDEAVLHLKKALGLGLNLQSSPPACAVGEPVSMSFGCLAMFRQHEMLHICP